MREKRAREVEKMLRAAIEKNRASFGRTIDRLKKQRDQARDELEMSDQCLHMIRDLLEQMSGESSEHIPPMMYPEWIQNTLVKKVHEMTGEKHA